MLIFDCKMLLATFGPDPFSRQVFKKLTVTAVLQESQLSAKQTSWISQERWGRSLVDRPFQPDNIIVTIVTSFFENTETTLLDIFHWWPPHYYLDKNDARCDHCDHWRISWSKYCKWLKVFKPLKRTDLVANWMIPKGFSWQRRGFPARALGMFLLTLENPETWRINETCSAVSIALGLAGS